MDETIKKDYYRTWDEENEVWVRHALWTTADQVEMDDGTTVQRAVQTLRENFQDGCSMIYSALSSADKLVGVAAPAKSTPKDIGDNIYVYANKCYDMGFMNNLINNDLIKIYNRNISIRNFENNAYREVKVLANVTYELSNFDENEMVISVEVLNG